MLGTSHSSGVKGKEFEFELGYDEPKDSELDPDCQTALNVSNSYMYAYPQR